MEAKKDLYYDPEDPFIGKRIMWRKEEEWDRCYYCGSTEPKYLCKDCKIVKYCDDRCASIHKKYLHTTEKCAFVADYYQKWKTIPVLIGSDAIMGNNVLSSASIKRGTEIASDAMLFGFLFEEEVRENKERFISPSEIKTFENDVHFTYIYNLVERMYLLYSHLMYYGVYYSMTVADKEEEEIVKKMIALILKNNAERIKLGTSLKDLEKFKFTISTIYGIVRHNTRTLCSHIGGIPLCKGFFPLFSLINHHCSSPNCAIYYTGNGKAKLIAIRDINKGDELFISYHQTSSMLAYPDRKLLLNVSMGFDCKCSSCLEKQIVFLSDVSGCIMEEFKKIRRSILGIYEDIDLDKIFSMKGALVHFVNHPICSAALFLCISKEVLKKMKDEEYKLDINDFKFVSHLFCNMMNNFDRAEQHGWGFFSFLQSSMMTYVILLYFLLKKEEGIFF